MPKLSKEFDQAAYIKEYQRTHYKKMAVVCTIEEGNKIEKAAKAAGMSKSVYMKTAIFEKIERETK